MKVIPHRYFILGSLAIWAAFSLLNIIRNTAGPLGSNDLYTYWYAGLHIRQGVDPYLAFIESKEPILPIQFLNGSAESPDQITIPGLIPAPGYTYPFLLIFTLLAFFKWQSAKLIWLIINLALTASIIPLLVKTIPFDLRPDKWIEIAFVFVIYGLSASRYALSSGQVVFGVLFLILICIIFADRYPVLAGLALGLALSKYSLSAGIFIYFLLFEPKPRLVASAVLVQLTGIVGLLAMSKSSLAEVIQGYSIMFEHHLPMDGIHLASLIPLNNNWFDFGFAIIFTLVVTSILLFYKSKVHGLFKREIMISILILWSLLVAYHRAYDVAIIIYPLFILSSIFFSKPPLEIETSLKNAGKAVISITITWLLLPAGDSVRKILPPIIKDGWTLVFGRVTTLLLLTNLVFLILLIAFRSNHKEVSFENDRS